jgi:colanic acid/amylovoran biosynthesis glycosyltransferase
VTFYGLDVNYLPKSNPAWYDRYRRLFAAADRFLCEGSHMAQRLEQLGCPANKIDVHHLGVNVRKITFHPRVWQTGPLRILMAATFKEKKGIIYGLEALGKLQSKFPLEITLIGDATAEPRSQLEKQKIMAAINRNHLVSRVHILGYQPYSRFMEEAYQHHIFLSPSVTAADGDTEGGAPVSLIDLSASGMPIVSTRHCDIPEVIQDEKSGLLADERDVDGLANALEWMAIHKDSWKPMAISGRQHIEAEYNAERQGIKLAAIYHHLVNP